MRRAILLALVLFPLLATSSQAGTPAQHRAIICQVFGRYCSQAIAVASCETGGTFSVWAQNGQYLGLFQMGSYARSRYGPANHAWGQARAAYRYFVDSGRDWSPWSCRPW